VEPVRIVYRNSLAHYLRLIVVGVFSTSPTYTSLHRGYGDGYNIMPMVLIEIMMHLSGARQAHDQFTGCPHMESPFALVN
jgi:hypothetical protein